MGAVCPMGSYPGGSRVNHPAASWHTLPPLGTPLPPGYDPICHTAPTHKLQKYNQPAPGAVGGRERDARTVRPRAGRGALRVWYTVKAIYLVCINLGVQVFPNMRAKISTSIRTRTRASTRTLSNQEQIAWVTIRATQGQQQREKRKEQEQEQEQVQVQTDGARATARNRAGRKTRK